MAQDPVLQREMFNTRGRSAKGSGITSMVDDGSSGMTREERMQMAKDMLAEAQMKQTPEYYFNTLAASDRPAMTRPVASSAPPPAMQPMPAAQQMAQMQAAGVRPVGMADGGIVRKGYEHGGLHSEGGESVFKKFSDFMYPEGQPEFKRGQYASSIISKDTAPELTDSRVPTPSRNSIISTQPPATWLDEDIESIADDLYNTEVGLFESTKGESAAGRGLQSLNPFRRTPDRASIVQDLKNKREMSIRYREEEKGAAAQRGAEDKRLEAMSSNPVPSIFAKSTPEQTAEAQAKQAAALAAVDNTEEERRAKQDAARERREADAVAPTGIAALPSAAQTAGGSGDYMAKLTARSRATSPDNAPPAADRKQTALEAIKAEREAQKNQNFNMALMQAGLAMMAGKSPNALQNIAEGGISGLAAYTGLEKSDRETALAERKLGAYEDSLRRSEDYNIARALALSDKAKKDMQAIAIRAEELAGKELENAVKADTEGKLATQDQRENWYLERVRALKRNLGIDLGTGVNSSEELDVGEIDPEIGAQF